MLATQLKPDALEGSGDNGQGDNVSHRERTMVQRNQSEIKEGIGNNPQESQLESYSNELASQLQTKPNEEDVSKSAKGHSLSF